jgi:outer membrane protein assembly factor BamD
MTIGKAWRSITAAVLLGVLVAGCAEQAAEVDPIEQMGAQDIFTLAERTLADDPQGTEAARLFSEVERLHPYTEWARRSLVMQAYAHHQAGRYDEARSAAQRYLEVFSGDTDAAWARYILALSYYDQIDAIGRDQALTFEALRALRDVIELHPESEYARSARLKFDLAFDHLAAKEMEVGRYYLRDGHYAAAINRFRVVVEEFQTTTHTPEALHRLVECYLALGLATEAQTAGAILGHNYASSGFYEDSYALLTGQGLSPEASDGEGWLQRIWRQTLRGEWL